MSAPQVIVTPVPGQNPGAIYVQQNPNQPVVPNIPMPMQQIVPIQNQAFSQYVYVIDPLAELAQCQSAYIKQEPEYFEAFTGCETPNRYHVFCSNNNVIKYLFKCREVSGYCERMCCPANNRTFSMEIRHITSSSDYLTLFDSNNLYANIFKPCQCTCCCFCRPKMTITINKNNQIVGSVVDECSVCDPLFGIYDETGQNMYTLTTECCQCGICCANNYCGKTSEVIFPIYKNGNLSQPVGTIRKKPADSFSELITSADSYQILFPIDATPIQKFLLICNALMIDYQYFEEAANESNHHRHGYGYRYRHRYY